MRQRIIERATPAILAAMGLVLAPGTRAQDLDAPRADGMFAAGSALVEEAPVCVIAREAPADEWRVHHVLDYSRPLLLPEDYVRTGASSWLSADGRSVLLMDLEDAERQLGGLPPHGRSCRTTIGGTDVLIVVERTGPRRWRHTAWPIVQRDEFGPVHHTHVLRLEGSRRDAAVFWTLVQSAWGQYRLRSRESPSAHAPRCRVELILEIVGFTWHLGDQFVIGGAFGTRLENRGSEAVLLVPPGDGSGQGERTPVTRWEIAGPGGDVTPAGRFCASRDPLGPNEVINLRGGRGRLLDAWLPALHVAQAGTYRVRLHYSNQPELEWSGHAWDDPLEMARVRASAPCDLVSNWVTLQVPE